MAAAVQINNVNPQGGAILVTGFIVLSGTYPVGGDVLNFATATADPSFIGLLPAAESSACLNIDVWSMGGGSISAGNQTSYDVACTKTGTPAMINLATGIKLKVGALATPSTPAEHAAGAYEAQYTGDLIAFQATFTKLV